MAPANRPDPSSRPLILLAILGFAACGGGLAWHHPALGLAGLGMALASWVGLFVNLGGALREARKNQDLLGELNENLDEQVQVRTLRLMQTIGELESFNRMITHDLRSPLTAMLGTLDLLEGSMEGPQPEKLQARLTNLRGCAERMRDLIEGLQELALISGRLPAIKEVDVSQYADRVFRHLQFKEPERAVHWVIEPGLTVFGDPNLIHIALENLLGNAWKYTVGRAPARIQVRSGKGKGRILEIQDNGLGFDMAKADSLFQPFKRLHADPAIPGHGIGLSIVKRVMDKHSGRASGQGMPGQGAIFRLEFPEALEAKAENPRP